MRRPGLWQGAMVLVLCAGVVGCRAPAAGARPAAPPFLNMPPDGRGPLPALLSQTGAFADVRTLTPAPGLLPYDVNVPFWSDGAAKTRWVALPGRVRFAAAGAWGFPEGTVFVKHFEIAADGVGASGVRRLETRLLVHAAGGGVYGASYRWRADHGDADLVREGTADRLDMGSAPGTITRRWYWPGPEDCGKCHTAAAGGVLGVNTRQLNRAHVGPTGATDNQLRTWNRLGLFEPALAEEEIAGLPSLAGADCRDRTLEDRARSYLDVNCAYCHRPGGAAADFDGRYDTPLADQRLVGVPARINLGIDRARFIAPNDEWRSLVLVRVNTLDGSKMPPLGHEAIDEESIALLREWVRSLPGPPVLGPPSVEPKGGDFPTPVRVRLRHEDPDAVVRYTLDGAAPVASSPAYIGPLEITGPATLRARAFRAGHTSSVTVQETFLIGE